MKKFLFSLTAMLHNRKIMMAVSLVLAIIIWVLVVSGPANVQDRTLTIPVNVNLSNTYAEQIGLRLSSEASTEVTVVVQGPLSVISRLTAADLRARADVSTIQKAGRQDVTLTVVRNSEIVNYDIVSFYPASISVTCDYWETDTFQVEVDTSSLSVEDATTMQLGTPILDPSVTTDGTLTLSGPKSQISKVDRLAARIASSEVLSDVRVFEATLVALDASGSEVSLDGCTIAGLSTRTINVTVPVWVYRLVPLTYTLQNAPAGLTDAADRITVTPPTVTLLGPASVLDALGDPGDLGAVNFDHLSPDYNVLDMSLSLPDSVQVINGETTVALTVDLSDFTSKTLTFLPSEATVVYNGTASGRQATVLQRAVSVYLVGSESSLSAITAADLTLTVTLPRNASAGTAVYPARVQVKGHDDVWVYYGEDETNIPVYVTLV